MTVGAVFRHETIMLLLLLLANNTLCFDSQNHFNYSLVRFDQYEIILATAGVHLGINLGGEGAGETELLLF